MARCSSPSSHAEHSPPRTGRFGALQAPPVPALRHQAVRIPQKAPPLPLLPLHHRWLHSRAGPPGPPTHSHPGAATAPAPKQVHHCRGNAPKANHLPVNAPWSWSGSPDQHGESSACIAGGACLDLHRLMHAGCLCGGTTIMNSFAYDWRMEVRRKSSKLNIAAQHWHVQ